MKVFSSETVYLHLFMHQYKIFFHLITSFSPLRCPGNLKITKVEGGGVKKMQPPRIIPGTALGMELKTIHSYGFTRIRSIF